MILYQSLLLSTIVLNDIEPFIRARRTRVILQLINAVFV